MDHRTKDELADLADEAREDMFLADSDKLLNALISAHGAQVRELALEIQRAAERITRMKARMAFHVSHAARLADVVNVRTCYEEDITENKFCYVLAGIDSVLIDGEPVPF
jgi:hypothetical protein